MEAYEYRRLQAGATWFWTPLRFPGQYYDFETDLVQNWNRFYDPSIGRYLGSEPLWADPRSILKSGQAGRSVPSYAYAGNNPVMSVDPDGRVINYLDSTGNPISAESDVGTLFAAMDAMDAVGVLSNSTNSQVQQTMQQLSGPNMTYNIYLGANIVGDDAALGVSNRVSDTTYETGLRNLAAFANKDVAAGRDPTTGVLQSGGPAQVGETLAHEIGHISWMMQNGVAIKKADQLRSGQRAAQFSNEYRYYRGIDLIHGHNTDPAILPSLFPGGDEP